MESQPPPPINPRSHLDTLAQAKSAARVETYPRSPWWSPYVAAIIGPIFVAAEVLDGAMKYLTVGGFLVAMAAIAVREARKPRVRPRIGPLPGRLKWFHFGFMFILIISLQLGELVVDRMHNGLLAVLAYLVYLAFFLTWVKVFDRMITNCTSKRPAA